MTTLSDILVTNGKRSEVVEDCLRTIGDEVADKRGLSGIAIKTGYKAVQGIKPGFLRKVMNDLLPDFARVLDPLYQEAHNGGGTVAPFFAAQAPRVAEALLSITDDRAAAADAGLVKKTYAKLRPVAKQHVEAAAPRLGQLIARHAP